MPLISLALFGLSSGTLTGILNDWGYAAVFFFVAVESSGIPFPGETMLVTAAVYAGTGHLDISLVIAAAAAGAIVGDNLGYLAGRAGGRPLLERYGKYIHLRPRDLERAQRFFDRYGDRTVFFGRFVAVLRAWAAFLAGVNRMHWAKFLVFNAAGGILWATLYGLLGYFLGDNLTLLHHVTRAIAIGSVVVAVIVIVVGWVVWRRRAARRRERREEERELRSGSRRR